MSVVAVSNKGYLVSDPEIPIFRVTPMEGIRILRVYKETLPLKVDEVARKLNLKLKEITYGYDSYHYLILGEQQMRSVIGQESFLSEKMEEDRKILESDKIFNKH
jgi:hypothetical protein